MGGSKSVENVNLLGLLNQHSQKTNQKSPLSPNLATNPSPSKKSFSKTSNAANSISIDGLLPGLNNSVLSNILGKILKLFFKLSFMKML